MRIVISGATGFLGSALAAELHRRGHSLVALVRSARAAAPLVPRDVALVEGRLEEPSSWEAALPGADALVHAAALVKMWARDRRDFDRVNVTGADRLLRAAAEAGIPRIVHASSFMALGPSNGSPLREDDDRRAPPHNDYERTKHEGDLAARRIQAEGAPLWILYPGVVYGPGPLTQGSVVARTVRQHLAGRMALGLAIETWSYAWIDDVVRGFVRVIEDGGASRRYVLGGENRSGAEFWRALEAASGRRAPRWNLPRPLAMALGWAEIGLAEAFGREPTMLTPEVVRIYRRSWALDSRRAVSELGYAMTPLEVGLVRLVRWLRETRPVLA